MALDSTGFGELDAASLTRNSNNPPADISFIDEYRERLAEQYRPLLDRRDELLGSIDRSPKSIAEGDEETCGKLADLIKMVTACHKVSETSRVGEKEPHLQLGRATDGFFKGITDPLEKGKKSVEQVVTIYQRHKAETERRRREEEARQQRIEAERARLAAEEAARQAATEKDLDEAIVADEQAKVAEADAAKAKREAEAKPAELSRSRGDFGAVASLKRRWVGELTDRDTLDLDQLRHHLPEDALVRAINAFVRAGGRSLKGADIREETYTAVV